MGKITKLHGPDALMKESDAFTRGPMFDFIVLVQTYVRSNPQKARALLRHARDMAGENPDFAALYNEVATCMAHARARERRRCGMLAHK